MLARGPYGGHWASFSYTFPTLKPLARQLAYSLIVANNSLLGYTKNAYNHRDSATLPE